MHNPRLTDPEGPFDADDIVPDSSYELYDGHPSHCLPTGGDGASTTAVGVQAITTDPDVEEAGVDPGYVVDSKNVHAPDIAVGNVPDRRGFIPGVPALAVEYAGEHQDEVKLQDKIEHFLAGGTRFVWVVRLIGPRRVEVYEPGQPPALVRPGETLRAPGVLRNEIPMEALFERRRAREVALRNLLEVAGYAGLDAVREEGREAGREDGRLRGLREAVLSALSARGLSPGPGFRERVESETDPEALRRLLVQAVTATSPSEL